MIALLIVLMPIALLVGFFFMEEWANSSPSYWKTASYRPRSSCCPEVASNRGGMPWGDHRCKHKWKGGLQFPKRFKGRGKEAWDEEMKESSRGSWRDRFRTCCKCGRVEQYLSTCTHWGF